MGALQYQPEVHRAGFVGTHDMTGFAGFQNYSVPGHPRKRSTLSARGTHIAHVMRIVNGPLFLSQLVRDVMVKNGHGGQHECQEWPYLALQAVSRNSNLAKY